MIYSYADIETGSNNHWLFALSSTIMIGNNLEEMIFI